MWILFFQKYWLYFLLFLSFLFCFFTLLITRTTLQATINERDQYKSALEFQNTTLMRDAEEHEKRLKELPKVIEKITVRYKTIYENIDTWEGDDNASDCDNADKYLRSFNY